MAAFAPTARFWERLGELTYEQPIVRVYGGALAYLASLPLCTRQAVLAAAPPEFGRLETWPETMRREGADAAAVQQAQMHVTEILCRLE
jgi:hypothetical protein